MFFEESQMSGREKKVKILPLEGNFWHTSTRNVHLDPELSYASRHLEGDKVLKCGDVKNVNKLKPKSD